VSDVSFFRVARQATLVGGVEPPCDDRRALTQAWLHGSLGEMDC
jgi:hypothetical protein